MTKAERAAEMSRVRKLGVKRAKTKTRDLRQNADFRHGSEPLPARTGSLTGENEEKPNKSGTK